MEFKLFEALERFSKKELAVIHFLVDLRVFRMIVR